MTYAPSQKEHNKTKNLYLWFYYLDIVRKKNMSLKKLKRYFLTHRDRGLFQTKLSKSIWFPKNMNQKKIMGLDLDWKAHKVFHSAEAQIYRDKFIENFAKFLLTRDLDIPIIRRYVTMYSMFLQEIFNVTASYK